MNRYIKIDFKIVCLNILLLFSIFSYAQTNNKLVVLDSIVGETIDKAEKEKYYLFEFKGISEFSSAQFFTNNDSTFLLKIQFVNGNIKDTIITKNLFFEYKDNIRKLEEYFKEVEAKKKKDTLIIKHTETDNSVSSLPKEDELCERNTYSNRIAILIPGIMTEIKLSPKTTCVIEIGMGFALSKSYFDYNIFSKIDYRYYYNIEKRKKKHKITRKHSANFISFYSLILFGDLIALGPTWGFQRNFGRFYFNMNIGAGLYLYPYDRSFQGILDFSFGINLNK